MICGVVASDFRLPVPIVAAGAFDFVAGAYDWLGTPLSAAQVTDQTGWIGGGGLQIPASASRASIIYAATKTFLGACAFTAAIEVEILSLATDPDIFVIANAGDAFFIELKAITSGTDEWFLTDTDGGPARFAEFTNPITTGIHRIAFTRTEVDLSISADGNDVVTTTDAPLSGGGLPVAGFPMTQFYLGGWFGTNSPINIRSVAIYDPQSVAALPGLSL